MSVSGRVPKLAMVVVTAVAVMLGAASSARADASVSVSFHGHLRGVASFDGGDFRICDERTDNLPVAVRYSYIRQDDTPVRRVQWHTAGAEGSGRPRFPGQFATGCSYAPTQFIGKDRPVWIQACVRHENRSLQCSKVQRTESD
jgi:hypothetical protein